MGLTQEIQKLEVEQRASFGVSLCFRGLTEQGEKMELCGEQAPSRGHGVIRK